ncbi:hypothetical protein [Streptomyces sp. WM6386]|uniref:hypothetical protein n=1 Tax=Streptomyces sp. WM6386 TaxID=1415558 RepID=UPI0006192093|nr:hypothetical protein [Streptomyces sp. WM6386]KKD08253.1 hypothetical protein TN53_08375 [Streptomyces sp. WM6386]
MNNQGRRGALRWTAAAAVIGTVLGVTGCQQTSTRAAAKPQASEVITGMAASGSSGGACVFVKPDGAQKFGHVGWGFRVAGTDRWVYGAVENPSGSLYTPPGGDIGAWHAEGSYDRMLSEMSRDALPHSRLRSSGGTPIPGNSEHPYSRYRCTKSSTHDTDAARAMIRIVESRGFLVGFDPKTGDLTSRDCLDATYDVLKAYRTKGLTRADKLSVPNVWIELLWGWSDKRLTPR